MTIGNRGRTENLRPYQPGQSGNLSGRPKGSAGLAAYISERTLEGRALADFYFEIFEGKRRAPLRLRMEAADWLATRGFGRPTQPLEHTGEDGGPMRLVFDGGP